MSIEPKKTVSKKDVIDTSLNDFYTVEALSIKSGIGERTLRESLIKGNLKGFKKFTRWFILHNDFIEFIKSNQ